jgi:uncharacterized coiled-coil DUF342 family protein
MTDDLVKRLKDRSQFLWTTEKQLRDNKLAKEAADRIEQLAAANEELSNCVAVLKVEIRKMALDYLAAQGQASENFQMYVDANEARIDAETSLAKVVEALDEAWYMLTVPHLNYEPEPEEPGLRRIKTTLAELKERTSGIRPLMSGAKK